MKNCFLDLESITGKNRWDPAGVFRNNQQTNNESEDGNVNRVTLDKSSGFLYYRNRSLYTVVNFLAPYYRPISDQQMSIKI